MEKLTTRSKIFNKAVDLFNREGIEYVGVRELAKELGISPGNFAYHFPKKEDLIVEVARELGKSNSEHFKPFEEADICPEVFLTRLKLLFHNHYKFRCLFLSFVHLIHQYPSFARNYHKTAETRNNSLRTGIKRLIKNGHFNTMKDQDTEDLVAHINLIARFWISESAIVSRGKNIEETITHYMRLVAHLFEHRATGRGAESIRRFLNG